MTDTKKWHAADLVRGTGPRLFEMFLEPTCPFSVKALRKIDALLAEAGADKITVRVILHSQPWHMYSGVITRGIIAASTLENGCDAAFRVMEAVAEHREEFEFEDHARGANMDRTPRQILKAMEDYSHVPLAEAFDIPDLDKAVKKHTKYARQNGIHVSPTFMIDSIIAPKLGSGDPVSTWAEAIFAD